MQAPDDPSQGIFQAAEVRGQPDSIRSSFGLKVYSIVFTLALACFGFASPFVFRTPFAFRLLTQFSTVVTVCWVLAIIMMLVHFGVAWHLLPRVVDTDSMARNYMWLMRTSPLNMLYLLFYSLVTGIIIGSTCLSAGHGAFLGWVFGSLCVGLLLLSVFAVVTSMDFSIAGARLGNLGNGLLFLCVIRQFVHFGPNVAPWVSTIFNILWVFLISFVLMRETQLIFGTARPKEQAMQYTIDMYAFAAFHLYHIFAFLFITVLAAASGVNRLHQMQHAHGDLGGLVADALPPGAGFLQLMK